MGIKHLVKLNHSEREFLFDLIDKGRCGKEKLTRARILLKADCGEEGECWSDSEISDAFYVSSRTVERTRKSLVENGFEATINRRPSNRVQKRIIEGEEEAHLIALACSSPPEGFCRWSLKLLATKMVELSYVSSVSHETVRKALKKTNLSLG